MRPAVRIIVIATLALFFSSSLINNPVSAQAGSAMELINAVNNLRQNQGLAPYSVDNFLMGFAQSHSDYMASLGTWTHTRADGTTAFNYGIKENVAMGTNMSVQYCVYTVWSDWVHWQTMTAYSGGKVGAGVTIVNGIVYYTLNVLPEGSVYVENTNTEDTNLPVSQISQNTPVPYSPIITSTPDQDGVIIHVIKYGETLWTISQAYGVPIDEILRNNGLHPTTTQVREGQELLIRAATELPPPQWETPTPDPSTPTATQPRPTRTPFPTRTPAPTQTPTKPPSLLHRALGDGKNVGLGLILVSGLGVILVIYKGFLKNS